MTVAVTLEVLVLLLCGSVLGYSVARIRARRHNQHLRPVTSKYPEDRRSHILFAQSLERSSSDGFVRLSFLEEFNKTVGARVSAFVFETQDGFTITTSPSIDTRSENLIREIISRSTTAKSCGGRNAVVLEASSRMTAEVALLGVEYSIVASTKNSFLWSGFPSGIVPGEGELALAEAAIVQLSHDQHYHQKLSQRAAEVEKIKDMAKEREAFYSYFSHDIRSPLNNVRSILGLLRIEAKKEEEAELLELGLRNCDHVGELLDDLMDLAKQKEGKLDAQPQEVAVGNLVLEVSESYKASAALKGLTLRNELADENTIVHLDVRQIRRVLSNLIGNAIKYTDKGEVVVTSTYQRQRGVLITVSDTGCGMSTEQVSKLFTPFQRFSVDREGVGLGLVVSKLLSELNECSLSVTSELKRGSVFTFQIPVHRCVAEENEATIRYDKNVLLVDDDRETTELLSRHLEKKGYQVLQAHSVNEALGICALQKPECVLSDLSFPGGGIKMFLHGLRSRGITPRLAVLSGAHAPEELSNILPIERHFLKPALPEDVLSWVSA